MNGRALALGGVAALAVAGLAARRGSLALSGRARAREVLESGTCDTWDPAYAEARFYHVAPVESLPAIRLRGLRPDQREPGFVGFQEWSKGRVFLSAGEDARGYWERVLRDSQKRKWTSTEWVTLRVRKGAPTYKRVQHDWRAEHECSFYVEAAIPPRDLEIRDAAGTWVPLAPPATRGSRSQPTWSEQRAARTTAPIPSTWYHLTDRAKFTLDPRFAPADNALAMEDRSGRPGIYLGSDVERWVNGFGYWRPFVAEFHVDPSVVEDDGVGGRWGGELFVPASSFGKIRLQRVIPLDAWAREHYGSYGWIEGALEREFDTGKPIVERKWDEPPPFRDWRYPGPDVRMMPKTEVARLKKQLRQAKP